MSTIPAKAAKLIEDGAVEMMNDAWLYVVQSGSHLYTVTISEARSERSAGTRTIECDCSAGIRGAWCSHAQAAHDLDAQTPARTRAFDNASRALRTLWAIVDDEDLGDDEGVRTALLEAMDRFDEAENIDKEWRDA